MTIEQTIYNHALSQPEKTAVVCGAQRITYGALWQGIVSAKDYFVHMPDYAKGKCVIMAANKQIEFLFAYFGAHLAGLVVAPVDVEINPTRLTYIQNKISSITHVGLEKKVEEGKSIPLSTFAVELAEILAPSSVSFANETSVADVLFTTGTTGEPKCVPLTYGNEYAAACNINAYIGNTADDKELLALPISHSFGLGRVRCCLMTGQTIYMLNSFTNVKRFYRVIEEEGITGFGMVPASWKYLEKMSGNRLSDYANQLRYVEMGSAYLSVSDKAHLAHVLPNTKIAMHYGLTEASRSTFLEFHDTEHLSSVGKPSPNTDIKIFDAQGNEVGIGKEGEICIKGAHVTKGYWNADNSTTFIGEYFRTGDFGSKDAGGYVTLKSRIKELINVGGKKVAPAEVEEQLLKIKGIKDCACVPMSDPDGVLGEVVKAFVVLDSDSQLTEEYIRMSLMGKIEGYKQPVSYAFVESIPRTDNGKIKRLELIQ